ncbi:MAG TPA: V-type ATPase subunit [Candidatus Hydrogenedentes bacterium]|nr:V-type ATPase subunit [Candidatus Hydrogenedentota bacterium]
MRSLARYALANTVVRAKISEILTQRDIDGMARAPSLEEAWGVLASTPYGGLIPPWTGQEVYEIDRLLHNATGRRFLRVVRTLKGKPREVAMLLLSRWDLDALEFLLRLWHGKESVMGDDASYATFVHFLPRKALLSAEDLGVVAGILHDTPFAQTLISSSRTYAARHSLFHVETALEKAYYQRLLNAIDALGGQEARDGQTVISAEIDLLNLLCLARLVNYYEILPQDASEFIIPAPSPLSKQLRQPGVNTESFSTLFNQFGAANLETSGKQLSPLESISLLEGALSEIMVALARRALAGFPFSIAGVLAFYILIRVELRNLRSIFINKTGALSERDAPLKPHRPR